MIKDEEKYICLECGVINYFHTQSNTRRTRIFDTSKAPDETPSNMVDRWNVNAKIHDSTEKRLVEALTEITRLGHELSVSLNVLENAASIYKKLVKKRLLTRLNIHSLCAAAVYASCRQLNHPITLGELSKVSPQSKKEIGKSYRVFRKELGFNVPRVFRFDQSFPEKFGVEDKVVAVKILEILKDHRSLVGKHPSALTAAVCYISSQITNSKVTQRKLSEFYRITQMTIRIRYQEIMRLIDLEIHL